MTSTEKALLDLLRIAMGNGINNSLPTGVDWDKVIALAEKQGILSIAFDALEELPTNLRPSFDTLMSWIGHVSFSESIYEKYEQSMLHFSRLLLMQGVNAIVMKGYGYSLNYPSPNHRPCGDIDIFVTNKKGEYTQLLVDFSNQQLVKAGAKEVSHGNEHHSILSFEGYTLENHWTVLDVNAHKSSRYLEELLEKWAAEHREHIVDGVAVCLPSVRFNSIHLLRHMVNDFATVKTTLRHVLDWVTFVKNNDVDWAFVQKIARETNMIRFLDAVNGICVAFLGYTSEKFPVSKADGKLRDRVLTEILHSEFDEEIPPIKNKLAYGWIKTRRLLTNRWKYRIVYDESIWQSFLSLSQNRIKKYKTEKKYV